MKKIILALALLPSMLWAQQNISGKLVKKPWAKSTESYCAQGSDYYVLQMGDKTDMVLDFGAKLNELKPATFENKMVTLSGLTIERVISNSGDDNNISQRPISGPNDEAFKCKVFEVNKISLRKTKKEKMSKK